MKQQLTNILCALALLSMSSNIQSSYELADYARLTALAALIGGASGSASYFAAGVVDKCLNNSQRGFRQLGNEALRAGLITGSCLGSLGLVAASRNVSPDAFGQFIYPRVACTTFTGICMYKKSRDFEHAAQIQHQLELRNLALDLQRREGLLEPISGSIVPNTLARAAPTA